MSGPQPSTLYASFDLPTSFWKTAQGSLFADTQQLLPLAWPTWATWGPTGCWARPTAELPTAESDSGLWPTPVADDTGSRKAKYAQGGTPLSLAVKLYPTPTAGNDKSGGYLAEWGGSGARKTMSELVPPEEMFGPLNPEWVEWLMGWPIGWTDLKPLGTDKFREWLSAHGRR